MHPHLDRPKLYFVKLDVQACFDTIDQTKLLQILRLIISEVHSFVFSLSSLLMKHFLSRIHFWCKNMVKSALVLDVSSDDILRKPFQKVSLSLQAAVKWVSEALPFADDHPHFLRYATDLANALRNTIFVDQVPITLRDSSSTFFEHPERLYIPLQRGKKSYSSWKSTSQKISSR